MASENNEKKNRSQPNSKLSPLHLLPFIYLFKNKEASELTILSQLLTNTASLPNVNSSYIVRVNLSENFYSLLWNDEVDTLRESETYPLENSPWSKYLDCDEPIVEYLPSINEAKTLEDIESLNQTDELVTPKSLKNNLKKEEGNTEQTGEEDRELTSKTPVPYTLPLPVKSLPTPPSFPQIELHHRSVIPISYQPDITYLLIIQFDPSFAPDQWDIELLKLLQQQLISHLEYLQKLQEQNSTLSFFYQLHSLYPLELLSLENFLLTIQRELTKYHSLLQNNLQFLQNYYLKIVEAISYYLDEIKLLGSEEVIQKVRAYSERNKVEIFKEEIFQIIQDMHSPLFEMNLFLSLCKSLAKLPAQDTQISPGEFHIEELVKNTLSFLENLFPEIYLKYNSHLTEEDREKPFIIDGDVTNLQVVLISAFFWIYLSLKLDESDNFEVSMSTYTYSDSRESPPLFSAIPSSQSPELKLEEEPADGEHLEPTGEHLEPTDEHLEPTGEHLEPTGEHLQHSLDPEKTIEINAYHHLTEGDSLPEEEQQSGLKLSILLEFKYRTNLSIELFTRPESCLYCKRVLKEMGGEFRAYSEEGRVKIVLSIPIFDTDAEGDVPNLMEKESPEEFITSDERRFGITRELPAVTLKEFQPSGKGEKKNGDITPKILLFSKDSLFTRTIKRGLSVNYQFLHSEILDLTLDLIHGNLEELILLCDLKSVYSDTIKLLDQLQGLPLLERTIFLLEFPPSVKLKRFFTTHYRKCYNRYLSFEEFKRVIDAIIKTHLTN